jgi:hypothetical protein
MSIRLLYDHWHVYNQALTDILGLDDRRAARDLRRAQPLHYTRTSVLQRMLSHEPYHAGELSQTLGIAGLPQIDLWKPGT